MVSTSHTTLIFWSTNNAVLSGEDSPPLFMCVIVVVVDSGCRIVEWFINILQPNGCLSKGRHQDSWNGEHFHDGVNT